MTDQPTPSIEALCLLEDRLARRARLLPDDIDRAIAVLRQALAAAQTPAEPSGKPELHPVTTTHSEAEAASVEALIAWYEKRSLGTFAYDVEFDTITARLRAALAFVPAPVACPSDTERLDYAEAHVTHIVRAKAGMAVSGNWTATGPTLLAALDALIRR